MTISFQGLHLPQRGQQAEALKNILKEESVKKKADEAFKKIDRLADNKDVYLSLTPMPELDTNYGTYYSVDINDKYGSLASKGWLLDAKSPTTAEHYSDTNADIFRQLAYQFKDNFEYDDI